ncbi:MAG: N-acyl-D-amino-acid deacylase family protein [Acidimicrobiales bacterium]
MMDVVVRGGTVYDGSGGEPRRAGVGVVGDRIVAVGALDGPEGEARVTIDASGRAVSPGFVNILSHSYLSILHDPRSLGELTQGVTTEVFGEGSSMGPLTPAMKAALQDDRDGLSYEVCWSRLAEYLRHVESRGAAQNVASFIGAGTLRANAVGHDDRPATPAEVDRMQALVREEMADGALGIASALIYPPGSYAPTEELEAICAAASPYGGVYASHLRSEGAGLLAGVDEFLRICQRAEIKGEVFHLKASGRPNWGLMGQAIETVEAARQAGRPVTADVYPYTASSTGLTSVIPDRYHEGGPDRLYDRLSDPATRDQIRRELAGEPRWADVTRADDVLVLGVREEPNRAYQGHTLTEVAEMMGTDPMTATFDLIASDRSRVSVAFFSMAEDNLRSALARPWVAVSSDGASMAPEGVFLRSPTHPRAYGSFARVLGHYARDEGVLTLTDAVRRMSGLPAATLGLRDRGLVQEGAFADLVVFDPATVSDRATFADPHQLSVGVSHVLVNGQVTIAEGAFTGTLAGRALAGPGWRP